MAQRLPCLVWVWLIKGFGIIGINIYYISSWLIRRDSLSNITLTRPVSCSLRQYVFFRIKEMLVVIVEGCCCCIIPTRYCLEDASQF